MENKEPNLNTENYGEIFGNEKVWFIDDTNVYRVTILSTSNGNLTTEPLNGTIFVFNPKTGLLFLKILHSSVWEGQKSLAQLAKWKTAEEVAALIHSLPAEERPKKVISNRSGLIEPLEKNFIDFPNIVIRGSDIHLPFQACMRIDKLWDLIQSATESQLHLFNLYDNWSQSVSYYTCFSRLVLILRSLYVNTEEANRILYQDGFETPNDNIWPAISDDDWIKVEKMLKNLIINDYGKKNCVDVSSLTNSDIRDIILDAKLPEGVTLTNTNGTICITLNHGESNSTANPDERVSTTNIDE